MDTYKLNWTVLEHKLFELLCSRAGEKLSQREISKMLRVSPTAIANSVNGLKEFVVVERTKTINFISLNRNKEIVVSLKRAVNLKNCYISGLSEFLEGELPGSTIILFGSYSRGDDTMQSDIDIAVIERRSRKLNLEKYERFLNRKISTHFYEGWKKIPTELKNNILNGIVLHGSVDL